MVIEDEMEENKGEMLIKKDLITHVHYYIIRSITLFHLHSHDYKYCGEFIGHFFVRKFQNKGIQHGHEMSWIKNAQIYNNKYFFKWRALWKDTFPILI